MNTTENVNRRSVLLMNMRLYAGHYSTLRFFLLPHSHIQYSYKLQSGVARPSKCVHLLAGLAYAQHDADEQCAATDSEEEIDNIQV
jgi:hypothetical protein